MKQPTLAYLIPSRKHFDGLLRMVGSLRKHPDSAEFEIRVYLDTDDHVSLERSKELWKHNAYVHIGPRRLGYASTGQFCSEMAGMSKCPWITIADDDTVLEGGSFVEELKTFPTTGVYCTPEIYRLGNSSYRDFYQYGIVPNGAWIEESELIKNPTDLWMYNTLVKNRGWKVHRFKGTTMFHDWICKRDRD